MAAVVNILLVEPMPNRFSVVSRRFSCLLYTPPTPLSTISPLSIIAYWMLVMPAPASSSSCTRSSTVRAVWVLGFALRASGSELWLSGAGLTGDSAAGTSGSGGSAAANAAPGRTSAAASAPASRRDRGLFIGMLLPFVAE